MAKSSATNFDGRVPFEKWMEDLAAQEVDTLSAHMSKLKVAIADPTCLDETFDLLVNMMHLPKAEGQPKPWLYNVERKRFKDAFTSDGKNSGNDQMKYVSFVMKSLNLPDEFHSAEGLAELTVVNSLDFMAKFYATVQKAQEESLELRTLSRERLDRLDSFLKRKGRTIAKLSLITNDFKDSMQEFKAGKITLEFFKGLDMDRKGMINVLRKRIGDIDTQIQEFLQSSLMWNSSHD